MSGTSGPAHMFPDAVDTTSYMVEIPSDDWDAWKDTIPRSTPLYERLHRLVQLDAEFDGDADLAELRLTSMKFQRVHQRCQTALNSMADDDVEKVREELLTIRDIAEPYVE